MIPTRHIMLAILAVVLFCPIVVFGWILVVGNTTPYTARVEVAYIGCNSNNVVIQPNKQANIDAEGCLVRQIGIVLEKAQPRKPAQDVKVDWKRLGLGDVTLVQERKDVHINWQVPGHRDFWATIRAQPDGGFSLEADYGKGPIQEEFVKPMEKAFNQLGSDIDRDLIKPLEKAFSKESFDKAGQDINQAVIKPIETAFVSLGKDIEKGFVDFGHLFEKEVIDPVVAAGDVIVSKFKDCSAVVALGSEWAAKKSAYESAQGALLVADEINNADPLQYGVIAVQQAALLGLDAGTLGAEGLAHMMEGIGVIIGGGFNITEVSFDVEANDLAQGKLPLFKIKGFFFGKWCDMSFQFDVNNPEKSMEAVVKELIKIVPGV